MIELLNSITPEEIYRYGSWLFVFWLAHFLVKRMWVLFENRLKNIDNNVTENKQINREIARSIKDTNVIQAQMFEKLKDHDNYNKEFREKELIFFERLCDFLNGGNPQIKDIRKEIITLKQKMEKNNK
jgi:hypothetical protein